MTAAVWVIVDDVSATARAMPKSMTLTAPVEVIMTFAGLMSRWTMPALWLFDSASRTPRLNSKARRGRMGRPSRRMSRSVRPWTSSMTM